MMGLMIPWEGDNVGGGANYMKTTFCERGM